MMIWTQKEARRRGLNVNEAALQEATVFMLAGDDRANILSNPDVPLLNNENPAMLGPLYAMMAFREHPVPQAVDTDGTIPRWTAYLRSKQQADGFWLPHSGRPPTRADHLLCNGVGRSRPAAASSACSLNFGGTATRTNTKLPRFNPPRPSNPARRTPRRPTRKRRNDTDGRSGCSLLL